MLSSFYFVQSNKEPFGIYSACCNVREVHCHRLIFPKDFSKMHQLDFLLTCLLLRGTVMKHSMLPPHHLVNMSDVEKSSQEF